MKPLSMKTDVEKVKKKDDETMKHGWQKKAVGLGLAHPPLFANNRST